MGNPVDKGHKTGPGEVGGQWGVGVGTEPQWCQVLDCTISGLSVNSSTTRIGVQARAHACWGQGTLPYKQDWGMDCNRQGSKNWTVPPGIVANTGCGQKHKGSGLGWGVEGQANTHGSRLLALVNGIRQHIGAGHTITQPHHSCGHQGAECLSHLIGIACWGEDISLLWWTGMSK